EKEWEKETKDNPDIVLPDENPDPIIPTGSDKKTDAEKAAEREARRQEREHEKRLEDIKKFHEDRLKLAREYEDGNFQLMDESYGKEKLILDTQYQRKIEDLKAKLISAAEIEKAQNESKNQKLTEGQRKSYADLAQAWLDNNAEIYKKVEQETDLHCIKLATLVEKYSGTEIDLLVKKYEAEKILRETNNNNQLAALGANERAKEKLKKQFQLQELEAEQKHLEELVALYQKMLSGDTVDGIDFSLLSAADAAELQKNIDLVNNALSKLQEKKASLSGGAEKPLSNGEASLGLGQTDILGFSTDQWTTFFDNIEAGTVGIETMGMAVQALQNVWAQYGAMVEAGENRRMQQYEQSADRKERRLKSQLDRGVISNDQYNKAIEAIEADYNRKKAELEYKQAKRKKKMDIVSALSNT